MTRRAPDLALLRFLRARPDELAVLNDGPTPPATGPELAAALMRAARALVPDGETVPYTELAHAPRFARFRQMTLALRGFDPALLEGRRARTAFWINVFNALVVDAVICFGVQDSVREALGFFRRAAYQVGPHRFSLEEIEHGLLRQNRPPLPRLPRPFDAEDRRALLGPGMLDPRVHFALNCGTRSCPPIAFYEALRLDEQLEAAAASFINAEGVRLEDGAVVLSPLFDFYADDFGGAAGVRSWVLRYLTDPVLRGAVEGGAVTAGVYDWGLNRA